LIILAKVCCSPNTSCMQILSTHQVSCNIQLAISKNTCFLILSIICNVVRNRYIDRCLILTHGHIFMKFRLWHLKVHLWMCSQIVVIQNILCVQISVFNKFNELLLIFLVEECTNVVCFYRVAFMWRFFIIDIFFTHRHDWRRTLDICYLWAIWVRMWQVFEISCLNYSIINVWCI